MKGYLTLITALLLVFAGPSCLDARPYGSKQQNSGSHYQGIWFGNPDVMRERLNLSPEQMRQIASINERYQGIMTGLREKLRPLREQLRTEMLKRSVDRHRVRTILEKISKVEVEIRYNRITHRLDMEKVLTAEQKNMLQYEQRYQRRQRHHDR